MQTELERKLQPQAEVARTKVADRFDKWMEDENTQPRPASRTESQ
jgi:hypothetical protein